jgi:hypothetical protein
MGWPIGTPSVALQSRAIPSPPAVATTRLSGLKTTVVGLKGTPGAVR